MLVALLALPSWVNVFANIPVNKNIRHGVLPNGLTYYVAHNSRPGGLADFYILQRVGSMQEKENQRGMAHFLEHMAFHDTKNFPDSRIRGYLEENGVQFGSNLNASTSYDQTIYNIKNVPTKRESLVDSCLMILHDWSGCISLRDEDIETEKKVVHEEWRTRSNAQLRMLDALMPQVFTGENLYAKRSPIGLMSVIDHLDHKALADYYHRWYRPDLQAVVIIGDINVDKVVARLASLWQDLPAHQDAPERKYQMVEQNVKPLFAIASDKESKGNAFQIMYHYPLPSHDSCSSEGWLRQVYCRRLITSMLNARLEENVNKPGCPFLNASALDGYYFVAAREMTFGIAASFRTGEWKVALEKLIAELKRTCTQGFLETELERAKSNLMMFEDDAYENRNSRRNDYLVSQCVGDFLGYIPLMDEEWNHTFCQKLMENLTVADINAVARELMTKTPPTVMLMGVQLDDYPLPMKKELSEEYDSCWAKPVVAYVDSVGNTPIVDQSLISKKGRIVKSWRDDALGAQCYQLQNGAKVVIKHTDFDKNLIAMRAMSPGGYSLYDTSDLPTYLSINSVSGLGGLGTHSLEELTKLMAGKNATVYSSVNTYDEQLLGRCSPKYFETMMQLAYLKFQKPREDDDAFFTWRNSVRSSLQTQDMSMESAMKDSINRVLYNNDPRMRRFSAQLLPRVSYHKALRMYQERFAGADDFTFIFIGNIDSTTCLPLIEKYIGALPSKGVRETPKDIVPYMTKGRRTCHFTHKMETPSTQVQLSYAGKMKYTLRNRMKISILSQILNMVYTETLREKEGGTYGANCRGDIYRRPKDQCIFYINFTTSAEAWQRLVKRAKADMADIAKNGVKKEMFDKALAYMKKRHDNLLHENAYWLEALTERNMYGEDYVNNYYSWLDSITPREIQKLAADMLKYPAQYDIVMEGVAQ